MRVVALVHQYPPFHNAGAEQMLHGLLRALVDRGHDVTVMLSRQGGEPYVRDGVKIVPETSKTHGLWAVLESDVVVTHLENTPRAAVLGRLNGRPVVEVLHNTMRISKEWLVREPCALAVANSQWMLDDYQTWARAWRKQLPRSVVVRPAVRPDEYGPTAGDRITLVNLRPTEESFGGAKMSKGAETFWALAERLPRLKFLGVIGGYGAQDIRDLPNVEVLPHTPSDEMRAKVYARTRVLVMPSSYESWGMVASEAVACGIPVIASPTPGLVENLGDAGIYVDPSDVDGYVREIRRLAKPAAYAAAREAVLARAAEHQRVRVEDEARWVSEVERLGSRVRV